MGRSPALVVDVALPSLDFVDALQRMSVGCPQWNELPVAKDELADW